VRIAGSEGARSPHQDRRGLAGLPADDPDRAVQPVRHGAGARVVHAEVGLRQQGAGSVERAGEQLGVRSGQASPGLPLLLGDRTAARSRRAAAAA
jgi:hypothetical protein